MGLGSSQELLDLAQDLNDSATSEQLAVEKIKKAWAIDVNLWSKDGNSTLHWACYTDKPNLTRLLLQNGANPDAINVSGSTPLMVACRYGHSDVVKVMLESKVDPNYVPPGQEKNAPTGNANALTVAAASNHLEICQQLIRAGGRVQAEALYHCAHLQNPCAVFQLLMERSGVEINEPDEQGWTPLMIAVLFKQIELVRVILKNDKCNVNQKNGHGITALHCAYASGSNEIVQLLLNEGGADETIENNEGKRPAEIPVCQPTQPRSPRRSGKKRGLAPDEPDAGEDQNNKRRRVGL